MKKITSRQIALNGLVAGLYAAVTILTASFAYGNIQFRIAEALCPLVALEPSLTIGLTLGCLIANLFSTLPLPTILCNMLMVGAMLSAVLMPASEFWKGLAVFGAEVGAGEAVVLYILGIPLYQFIRKTKLIDKLLGRG